MSQDRTILIVDDEPEHCMFVSQALKNAGYATVIANDGPRAIELTRNQKYDLFLLDIRMQPMDGIQVLQELRNLYPDGQVIMLSAFGDIDTAVKCMKLGAYDFVAKPVNLDELIITVGNAMKSMALQKEVQTLRSQIELQNSAEQILGESREIQDLLKTIERIAHHDITVMIRGDSGTGKELTARALHARSKRAKEPFISVDCAALPENLVESELFGYERGAFTGAYSRSIGRFEQAGRGTLFLDEIGNLPVSVQVKLLRVLQEKKFSRLGGKEELPFNGTVITATNINLEKAIQEGSFREDLYYRLNEFILRLPPLRERKEDIKILVKNFMDVFSHRFSKSVTGIDPDVMGLFIKYPWPGNVRELKNVIKRAVVLAEDVIEKKHLPENLLAAVEPKTEVPILVEEDAIDLSNASLKEIVKSKVAEVEKKVIRRILETYHWNRSITAKKLGIDYKTLYNKMKEYSIE